MTTLYELLGALPHDDADELRAAFRKAAKTTHPDANPDDPDASLKFRQLVRAHDILSDDQQRAAYDQLLALALREERAKSRSTVIYETMHKIASNTIAATVISGVLVGSYALFVPISEAPAVSERAVEIPQVRQPIEVAALAPVVQSDAVARFEPREPREDTRTIDEVTMTGSIWPADGAEPIANIGLVPNLPADDAKSYRRRGIVAYRGGELYRALADFDLAIQRDPNYAEAYLDRGIVLYRLRQFDRAFADMTKAKRIGSAKGTKTTDPAPAPRKLSQVRVRDALNVADIDRFGDAPMQSMSFEKRR